MIYRGSWGRVIRLLAHPFPPPPPIPSANCLSFSVFLCVAGPASWRERGRGGERRWAVSYERKKAWSSINRSILFSLHKPETPFTNYHRLNMEWVLQSLFELHVHSCTHWLRPRTPPPPSPYLGSFTRALLVIGPAKIDDISLWPLLFTYPTTHLVPSGWALKWNGFTSVV